MERLEEINKKIREAIAKEGISTRKGMKFVGRVSSIKAKKTATIVIDRTNYLSKYSRYAKFRGKIHVHVPEGVELKVGDTIEAVPTRKISKTKACVVYSILKRE